jgi:hypothetical protein
MTETTTLVYHSPYPCEDVSLSFVKHNEGQNWKSAVNLNRECWLLLINFPLDCRNAD